MAAKRKRRGRGLGEIKRTDRRRTQAQKAAERTRGNMVGHSSGTRNVGVRATVGRDTGAVGSKRQGDYVAEVCVNRPRKTGRIRASRMHKLHRGYAGRCGTGGGRSTVFEDCIARVSDKYSLELHLDTDESASAGVKTGDLAYIV